MLTIIICLLLILPAITITNRELPELVKRTYHGVATNIINVTVGEQFSLPLPHFDSQWSSQHFKAYQISEQQFKQHLHSSATQSTQAAETTETTEQKTNKDEQNREPTPMDYLPFQCSLTEASSKIIQEIKSIPEEYSRVRSANWQENKYVLLSSKSLLYILNPSSSELTAYIFNQHALEKITSYKLDQFIQREEQSTQISVSPPTIALDSKQEKLYIFSSLGVWAVETKTILTNVKSVRDISGFNSVNYKGIDKALHGDMGIIVGMKRMNRVFVIPETSTSATYQFHQITDFNGTKIFPQDIAIMSNLLFVLDFYNGVYIYSIMHQGQPAPRNFISITSFGGNYQFKVYHNTIFVNFNDIDGSKVAQISTDYASETYTLVRFFKSDEFINKLNVFLVPTNYYLQPTQQKYSEDSFDSFLFLLESEDDLEVYPFNIDPRIINQAYNAVKIKGTGIREFFHIAADRFLLIKNQQIQYIKISIEKPSVVCRTKKPINAAPESYYLLQLTTNISTCQHKDHSQPVKRHFNEYCEMQMDYYLHVGDPQQSQHQKVLLYGIVLAVIVCFVGGLLCLMQWRNNKMVILSRLKSQIMNFRNRHKRIQPFVEQNYEQKDIEIEVPRVEAILQPE